MAVASPGWRTLLRERVPLVTVEWSQSRGESEVLPSKSLVGFLIQGSRWANRIRGTGSSVRPGRDEGSQPGGGTVGRGRVGLRRPEPFLSSWMFRSCRSRVLYLKESNFNDEDLGAHELFKNQVFLTLAICS